LERPELRYHEIEQDIKKLFTKPKEGADALLHRLKSMDHNSIKSILSARKDISEQDAERILNQADHVRAELMKKAEQMREEVDRRIERVEEEALRVSEESRRAAATAAWWGFATAFVSAIAAIWGGMKAVSALVR